MSSPVVRIIGLTRSFQQGDVRIDVLRFEHHRHEHDAHAGAF